MKLALNLLIFLFAFIILEEKSISLTDNQIEKICKKQRRKLTCKKNLKEKRFNLEKGIQIEIPVLPYKG